MRKLLTIALWLLAAAPALAENQANVPPKFNVPWGNAAVAPYIRAIPQGSQIGVQNCAASLTDGFPPLTFQPISAGGCGPFGQDMNGILKQVSQWARWGSAGNALIWDSAFSTAISGYPKGATLGVIATPGCFWVSTVDGNTSNPDTGGANWRNTCLSFAFQTQPAAGRLAGTYPNPTLANSGATAGAYLRPQVTVSADGTISSIASGGQPSYQPLAGPSGNYNPTAGTVRAHVTMVAGGGQGGSGSGAGVNGGTSSFGSWTALGGLGGSGGAGGSGAGGTGGGGGTNGTGTVKLRLTGGNGQSGINLNQNSLSGTLGISCQTPGGINHFGGGTGSGKGGTGQNSISVGGANTSLNCAGGGGAGEYVEFDVINPVGPIGYVVGAAGGGDALPGSVVVEEFKD